MFTNKEYQQACNIQDKFRGGETSIKSYNEESLPPSPKIKRLYETLAINVKTLGDSVVQIENASRRLEGNDPRPLLKEQEKQEYNEGHLLDFYLLLKEEQDLLERLYEAAIKLNTII